MTISNRKFGVELEFCNAPHPEVVVWHLRQLGLEAYDTIDAGVVPRGRQYSYWEIKNDYSITGPGFRYEIASPILKGISGLAEVRQVCRILQKLGCQTNTSCGLHVHVSDKHLSVQALLSLFLRYAENEKLIDSWIHKTRRRDRNHSCTSLKNTHKEVKALLQCPEERKHLLRNHYELLSVISDWRERKIHFSDYGTIEFRHHHGTLDPTEVSNWAQFAVNFVEVSADLAEGTRRATKRTRDTGPLLGLSTRIREHFWYQAERFGY